MFKKYKKYIALFSLSISHHVCAQVMTDISQPNVTTNSGFGFQQSPTQTSNSVTNNSVSPTNSPTSLPSNYSGFGYTKSSIPTNIAVTNPNQATPVVTQNPNSSNFGGQISKSPSTPSPISLPTEQSTANTATVVNTTTSQAIKTTSPSHNIDSPTKADELNAIQALSNFEMNNPLSKRNSAFGQFQTNSLEDESPSLYNSQNLQLVKGLTLLPDDDIVGANSLSGKTNTFGYKKLEEKQQNAFLIPGKRNAALIVTDFGQNSEEKKFETKQATTPLDDNIVQSESSSIVAASTIISSDPGPVAPPPASKGGLLDSITSIATAVATVADTISGAKSATAANAPTSNSTTSTTTSASVVIPSQSTTEPSDTSNSSSNSASSEAPPEVKTMITQEVSVQLPPLVQAEVTRQLSQMGSHPNLAPTTPAPAVSNNDQILEELPVFVAK